MEEMIKNYMSKLGISREEAIQLIEDDKDDYIGEEGEEMTKNAKSVKIYEQSTEKKERKPRERKIDDEKLFLLKGLASGLENKIGVDVEYENEVKLHFNYNGSDYSVTLTKHRKKK